MAYTHAHSHTLAHSIELCPCPNIVSKLCCVIVLIASHKSDYVYTSLPLQVCVCVCTLCVCVCVRHRRCVLIDNGSGSPQPNCYLAVNSNSS